ncbi:alpha/beta fold hydrolase [Nocardioides cheoyonin]|uniref:alpha/beta fold hydrolase n=1 Tax=Nocardioides cheoyonin TaxID=3156615 RepID=UPI0032B36DDC
MARDEFATRFQTIHGHRRAYVLAGRKVGTAPVLLLLHGLACDHHDWDPILPKLAEKYTVVAPDFLGHGESDKPRADYTLGGYANGMRDLLTVLGIDKVTVIGHSFGGGVAMQFAYQFPERTERLVLVDPGGLGPEVTVLIKAMGLPLFEQLTGLLTLPGIRHATVAMLNAIRPYGGAATHDLDEVAKIFDSLKDPEKRAAIHHLVSAVIDWRGQVVTMRDRAYLTESMPLAVVWGEDDRVIPASHARTAAVVAPKARVTVVPGAGHFPHKDCPDRFVELLDDFVSTTRPATYSRARWRRLLKTGGGVPPLESVRSSETA